MSPRRRLIACLITALAGLTMLGTGCGDESTPPSDVPTSPTDAADIGLDTDDFHEIDDDTAGAPDARDSGDDRTLVDGTGWDLGPGSDAADTTPPPLSLTSMAPSSGPASGGTKFVVEGQGLTTDTTLYIGTRTADVDLVGNRLVGETPEATGPGTVSVKAIDPETGRADLADGFTYTPSLEFDEARPSTVPTEGGFEVTLRGSGFTPETRISIDGTTALRHNFVDAERLRVVVPPGDVGSADLRITNQNESILRRDALTYTPPVEVDRVRPAAGTPSGGSEVTVHGRGFEAGMAIDFDNRGATVTDVDPAAGTATVETPSHTTGPVDVSIETPAGDAAIADNAFYYRTSDAGLRLGAVRPASGPTDGGAAVTVIGAGLEASDLEVAFGPNIAPIRDAGPGYAVVELPAHPVGTVDVQITTDEATSTLTDGFEYLRPLVLDRVSPASGEAAGGETITIEGTGFQNASTVEIGGLSAAFTVHDDSTLEVTTPAHAPGTFDVVVERGVREARLTEAFTFTEDLDVYGLSPIRGAIAGNTYVVIRGRGFLGGDLDVHFGGDAVRSLEILDAQTLAVRTPRHAPGRVPVDVQRGTTTVPSPDPFTFYNPAARDGGPTGGAIRGSVNVSVYADGGAPIEHAFVMLSTAPTDPNTGRTDENGQVTLSGPDVRGRQTVTAAAAGYSTASVQQVDAENITFFLEQIAIPPTPDTGGGGADAGTPEGDTGSFPDVESSDADGSDDAGGGRIDTGSSSEDTGDSNAPGDDLDPPTVPNRGPPVFHGELTGLDKIGVPGPDERPLAIVYTTRKRLRSRPPDPGPDNRLYGDGSYSIRTRTGDLALVAIGGLYNTRTDAFDLMRMGVKRYQHATKGQTYERDIELDIPLDETMTFKISERPFHPDGPSVKYVQPLLDFGFEGYFGRLPAATGDASLIHAPDYPVLEGQLSGVTVSTIGGAYTQRGGRGYGSPRSIVIHEDIASTTQTVDVPALLGVPVVTTPAEGERPTDDVIAFELTGRHRPDLFWMQLFEPGGKTIWEAYVPGSADRIRLPTFPDFSSLPDYLQPDPYPSGRYYIRLVAFRGRRATFDDFSYTDLSIFKWPAYAVNYQNVRF